MRRPGGCPPAFREEADAPPAGIQPDLTPRDTAEGAAPSVILRKGPTLAFVERV